MSIEEIPLNKLKISEFNVRKDVGNVSELAEAIKEQGLLQPLLVRHEDGKYGIIIGSRRYTAAKEANLSKVPVIIKDIEDDQALIISLVENLQRNDLQPKESAAAITLLLERMTERELAEKLGKSKGYVYNFRNLAHLVGRLEKHDIEVASQPSDKEREAGKVLPLNHAIHLANALDYSNVKHFFDSVEAETAENITIELAQHIAPIKQTDAQKALEIFKDNPDKPVPEIMREALYPDLGHFEIDKEDLHEMPTTPFEDQVHNKLLYNLQHIEQGRYDFYTIGYGHTELHHFIERLKIRGVNILIDVRKNAVSMFSPEYSRGSLRDALNAQGIEYEHIGYLGISGEERRKVKAMDDLNRLWKYYDDTTVDKVSGVYSHYAKSNKTIVFMCAEFDPTTCHRHRITRKLESKGLKGFDL